MLEPHWCILVAPSWSLWFYDFLLLSCVQCSSFGMLGGIAVGVGWWWGVLSDFCHFALFILGLVVSVRSRVCSSRTLFCPCESCVQSVVFRSQHIGLDWLWFYVRVWTLKLCVFVSCCECTAWAFVHSPCTLSYCLSVWFWVCSGCTLFCLLVWMQSVRALIGCMFMS